ncbi:recombinase family protein [Heyndrickxia ginsengihumi]|uniref:recombinase family protein n=1 Tax=Heyndrickxia ginsengihumi TaxID=363870 RepID=UPI00203D86FE|nr:recombinase family protein [Heyndrickxia ginsengihumi]MCM3022325.1 recombinase family protein [Heyndrickxia ginsengihumi]
MENNKLKVAIYTRVSTEEQKNGYSLKGQEEELKAFAERKGFKVVDVYVDGGHSGKNFNRPDVQRLFNDMRNQKFDAILVWKVDRLSRKNRDVLLLIDNELHPRNMRLLVSTCDIDSSNPNGYMFISLLGTFAEYERALIIERVSSGMQKRAESGKWNGGTLLGYDVVDKMLVINEDESKIVKQIFELRASGLGYKAITHILNKEGKKSKKNNSFSINAVKTILENKTYIGEVNWGTHRDWETKRRRGKADPICSAGEHEALIDIELWNRVQEVSLRNRDASTNIKNIKCDFILSGILRCPSCGAGTVMSKTKKRDGSGYHFYYMCQNYHSKGKEVCSSNLIRKELIEEKILGYINGMISKVDVVNEIIEQLTNEKHADTSRLLAQIKANKKELKIRTEELEVIDRDYRNKEITAKTHGRLTEKIEVEIEHFEGIICELEKQYEKITSTYSINDSVIKEALANFNELFAEASNDNKKVLVRSLIRQIEMEPNRKEVKRVVFWFSEGNAFSKNDALPESEGRRTVS